MNHALVDEAKQSLYGGRLRPDGRIAQLLGGALVVVVREPLGKLVEETLHIFDDGAPDRLTRLRVGLERASGELQLQSPRT
jgi:hypothetical protein